MWCRRLFAIVALIAIGCAGCGGSGAPGASAAGNEAAGASASGTATPGGGGTQAGAAGARTPGTDASAANPAGRAVLMPKGQKAVLEYRIEVEGKVDSSNKNGEHSNWSTKRTFVVRTTLAAAKATFQDPGEPRGPHSGPRPNDPANKPAPAVAAMAAELAKCGDDLSCKMRVSQQAMQDPQFQAEMEAIKSRSESANRGRERYQMWYTDSRVPLEGTVTIEDQTDTLFKTATREYAACRKYGESPADKALGGSRWPASFRFDAETGTYAANIAIMSFRIVAKTDCVNRDERGRTTDSASSGEPFFPEAVLQGQLAELESFRGPTDLAAGGRQLAHGERVANGSYGSVLDNKPMAARFTIRWTLTLKD